MSEVPDTIKDFHNKFIYPVVRVFSQGENRGSIGSGVCIYSDGDVSYILTNHHVAEALIEIESEWDAVAQRELKREKRKLAQVEFFNYENWSRIDSAAAKKATLAGWDADKDIALLELKGSVPNTAPLISKEGRLEAMFTGTPVVTVGCAMGVPPIPTQGMVANIGSFEIDGYPYILSTAPSIFGNSGGPVYKAETGEVIGLSARITVAFAGLASAPITHMSWVISPETIVKFFKEQIYDFIIDPTRTKDQCAKERNEIREKSLKSQRVGVPGDDED